MVLEAFFSPAKLTWQKLKECMEVDIGFFSHLRNICNRKLYIGEICFKVTFDLKTVSENYNFIFHRIFLIIQSIFNYFNYLQNIFNNFIIYSLFKNIKTCF